jgi:hypothetical protein
METYIVRVLSCNFPLADQKKSRFLFGLGGKRQNKKSESTKLKQLKQAASERRRNGLGTDEKNDNSVRRRQGDDDFGLMTLNDIAEVFDPWQAEASTDDGSDESEEGDSESSNSMFDDEDDDDDEDEDGSVLAHSTMGDSLVNSMHSPVYNSRRNAAKNQQTNEVRLKYDPNSTPEGLQPLPNLYEEDSYDDTLDSVAADTLDTYDRSTTKPAALVRHNAYDEIPIRLPRSVAVQQPQSVFSAHQPPPPPIPVRSGVAPLTGNKLKTLWCTTTKLRSEDMPKGLKARYPINELSRADLAEIFPKLRSVSEDETSKKKRSQILGSPSTSVADGLPATFQVLINDDGTQALYEYEYDTGTHQVLVFQKFGMDPRKTLKLHKTDLPPESFERDSHIYKVMVQIEVCCI